MIPWKVVLVGLGLIVVAVVPTSCRQQEIKIGSKKFTESVILGEMLSESARSQGFSTKHYQELGGTRLVFNALVDGEIDAYPEYTGTIDQEILANENVSDPDHREQLLKDQGILISEPIGFNNTYALGMLEHRARELGIQKVSDLNRHPDLKLGMTNEFMDRGDGWPALKADYGLSHSNVTGLDHDIAYRQLQQGAIDVMDVYTTDAKIKTLGIALLEDDRKFFPRYDAVVLFREDLSSRGFEEVAKVFADFPSNGGKRVPIDESKMVALNHSVEIGGQTEKESARQFLKEELGSLLVDESASTATNSTLARTGEHLDLVRKSLLPAILFGVPLGILAHRSRWLGPVILGAVGIIQTIPALALLVLVMPLVTAVGLSSLGVGSVTAVIALFLYSLLPIVAGVYTGLNGIEKDYIESAQSIGMTNSMRLWKIEMPLASWSILSGVRTAAVINVGFATLGALIGAGGYGQPILTGIRLDNINLILQGAIPAAVLALLVLLLFHWARVFVIPAGLRMSANLVREN